MQSRLSDGGDRLHVSAMLRLWSLSPMRFFSTPLGSFWRERRIDPVLYMDGNTVYELVYRYRDGKNGMKPVAKLSKFLASPGLGYKEKMRAVKRLKGGMSRMLL